MIKKHKPNILKLIIFSNLVFCMIAFIVVNVMIPHRFESDAKETIINPDLLI